MSAPPVAPSRTRMLPGEDWLYAKLYCGRDLQDDLLTGPVAELVAELAQEVPEWFVMRYADPEPHLRLRFRAEPSVLTGPVLGRLRDWASGLLTDRRARRFELATYEPEVSRYGGPEMLPLAHRVFHVDSQLAVDVRGDRHLAAVTGSDQMITALLSGTPIDPVVWALSRIPHNETLQGKFRPRREEFLAATARPSPVAWSEALRSYGAALHATDPSLVDDVLRSLLHMHHNRVIGIDPHSERAVLAACRGLARVREGRRRAGR